MLHLMTRMAEEPMGPARESEALRSRVCGPAFEKYDHVRVKYVSENACSNAWAVNQRPPQIGDSAAVLEVLCEHDRPESYVVECVGESGSTIWLGEFAAGEIERI